MSDRPRPNEAEIQRILRFIPNEDTFRSETRSWTSEDFVAAISRHERHPQLDQMDAQRTEILRRLLNEALSSEMTRESEGQAERRHAELVEMERASERARGESDRLAEQRHHEAQELQRESVPWSRRVVKLNWWILLLTAIAAIAALLALFR